MDEDPEDEGEPKTKKAKKSKVHIYALLFTCFSAQFHVVKTPKAADINNANVPHNDNIKVLRQRWICHQKPGCASDHCFINPVDASHLPLGHSHFDVWAAAMVSDLHLHYTKDDLFPT